MSHSPTAQFGQGTGPAPHDAGDQIASSRTRCCPVEYATERLMAEDEPRLAGRRPPYLPSTISTSVPQTPTARLPRARRRHAGPVPAVPRGGACRLARLYCDRLHFASSCFTSPSLVLTGCSRRAAMCNTRVRHRSERSPTHVRRSNLPVHIFPERRGA